MSGNCGKSGNFQLFRKSRRQLSFCFQTIFFNQIKSFIITDNYATALSKRDKVKVIHNLFHFLVLL